MLHTLRHSPWQCDFATFCSMLQEGDDVLLIQDGVLAAFHHSVFFEKLQCLSIPVFVLQNDVDARGLATQISTSVLGVSYTEFVHLVLKHSAQMSW